jgi:DsbC/DsbD-like thiol-disulfide interchange protein
MRVALAVIVGFLVTPAFAGATGWQELAPDTRVRLITSDKVDAAHKMLAAIELDMPVNTKTYWRVPGETGIPTTLDLDGSDGIAAPRFLWPYPTIDNVEGYTDFVYYGPVTIPVEFTLEGPAPTLRASLLMGVCSDICVPAMANFEFAIDLSKPDTGQEIRIEQALANTPIEWTGPAETIGDPSFDPARGSVKVPVDTSQVDPGSVIADASDSGHLLGAPQKSPEPDVVTLPLMGGDDGAGLVGQPIQIIFMTQDGPYQVTRRVKALAPGAS